MRRPRASWLLILAALGCASLLTHNGLPPHVFRGEAPPDIAARALPVGAVAPDFTLSSGDGRAFNLKTAIAKGPAAIVFYRGHW